jgi:Protein of unknown function (DUF3592)
MIGLQVFSVTLLLLGILLSLRSRYAKRPSDSRYWPTTRGEIIDSQLTVETVPVPKGRPITLYGTSIRYRFQLGHKFYESSRIRWTEGFKSADSSRPRALLARYPVGRIVQVHYDPEQRGTAVLEPGAKVPLNVAWLVGLAFLMMGTAGVIAATAHP